LGISQLYGTKDDRSCNDHRPNYRARSPGGYLGGWGCAPGGGTGNLLQSQPGWIADLEIVKRATLRRSDCRCPGTRTTSVSCATLGIMKSSLKAKSQDGLVCACLRSGNPYFSETTCRLLATEKIPGKELARMPARFLSSSLLTTLSRATRQFFTHGVATRVEHGCIEAVTK
jgi:hypothetical protein